MKQKLKYWSICFLSLFLLISACASPAFAAGGALGADRNGTPYTYVIVRGRRGGSAMAAAAVNALATERE